MQILRYDFGMELTVRAVVPTFKKISMTAKTQVDLVNQGFIVLSFDDGSSDMASQIVPIKGTKRHNINLGQCTPMEPTFNTFTIGTGKESSVLELNNSIGRELITDVKTDVKPRRLDPSIFSIANLSSIQPLIG
jgi:hypothetical protein